MLLIWFYWGEPLISSQFLNYYNVVSRLFCSVLSFILLVLKILRKTWAKERQSFYFFLLYLSGSNFFQPNLIKQPESNLQFCRISYSFLGLIQTLERSTVLGWKLCRTSKKQQPVDSSSNEERNMFFYQSWLLYHSRSSFFSSICEIQLLQTKGKDLPKEESNLPAASLCDFSKLKSKEDGTDKKTSPTGFEPVRVSPADFQSVALTTRPQ